MTNDKEKIEDLIRRANDMWSENQSRIDHLVKCDYFPNQHAVKDALGNSTLGGLGGMGPLLGALGAAGGAMGDLSRFVTEMKKLEATLQSMSLAMGRAFGESKPLIPPQDDVRARVARLRRRSVRLRMQQFLERLYERRNSTWRMHSAS